MSVVCACILWVYVMNEQNPITTKVYQVPWWPRTCPTIWW